MTNMIIYLGIGALAGILFSIAYPDYAVTINNVVSPTVTATVEKIFGIILESVN